MDAWATHRSVNPAWEGIRKLGLERNLQDLEVYGLTVITPEQIRRHIDSHTERLRAAMLRACNEWAGGEQEFSMETNAISPAAIRKIFMEDTLSPEAIREGERSTFDVAGAPKTQFVLADLLRQDRVFEEIVDCPPTLALIEYYMNGCHLSSITGFVKVEGDAYGPSLGLHNDSLLATNAGQPLPSVQHPHVVNTNWILTDYTKDNGAFCIIPGSHRWQRRPEPREVASIAKRCVPVEAPAGSVLVFHGGVWHGAFPKVTPGLRLSVNAYYCQSYYKAQERFVGKVPRAMLERNSRRFAGLLGFDDIWGHEDRRGPLAYRHRGHPQPRM